MATFSQMPNLLPMPVADVDALPTYSAAELPTLAADAAMLMSVSDDDARKIGLFPPKSGLGTLNVRSRNLELFRRPRGVGPDSFDGAMPMLRCRCFCGDAL